MLRKMFTGTAVAITLVLAAGCSQESDPMFNEVAQVTVFSAAGYSVAVNSSLQLEGRAVTWGGTRVDDRVTSWASSNPSIATVSNTGLVTGKAVGSTLITATAQGVNSEGRLINVTTTGGTTQ
ncbi:MAG TPA: Ig-like domain-containing protein [Gemmatimonadaceae bacterium]|nr:Ig-like domain-containing protein [Gemmatimonadaceae bacterium]